MPQSPRASAGRAARAVSRFLIPVALVVAALGCGRTGEASAQQPHVVSGTVKTADGRPLEGAVIRVAGATGAGRGTTVRTRSDRRGNYSVRVPPGHYNVDAFYDLQFDGQVYRELWLDRADRTGCERQLSERGIVRHFVLRLTGPLRCTADFDASEPASYAGALAQVANGGVPAAARVRFTFTPVGALADGSRGRTLVFDRTGAQLTRYRGALGETMWLHDIPLGNYRVSAETTLPNGQRQRLTLRNHAGGAAGPVIDVDFPAKELFPYGAQTATFSIETGVGAPAAPAAQPAAPAPAPARPSPPTGRLPEPAAGATAAQAGGLPEGRYECSYRSPYAGEIPNGRSIVILPGGRYRVGESAGTYSASTSGVRWGSGPLAAPGTSVSWSRESDRQVLTIRGGIAAEDPDATNRCVRHDG